VQRIIVIGCCGAGKSTLAREMSQRLSLPLHHLDRLYWLPGWKELDRESFAHAQRAIIEEPAWILDGNYGSTMDLRLAACDTVVYLDLPTHTCFWGILQRRFARAPRPDMAEGCVERFDWEFYRYVFAFRRDHRPRTEKFLAQATHCTVHRLRSRREIRTFLSSL
jgi:adenylate kinase family enzyme